MEAIFPILGKRRAAQFEPLEMTARGSAQDNGAMAYRKRAYYNETAEMRGVVMVGALHAGERQRLLDREDAWPLWSWLKPADSRTKRRGGIFHLVWSDRRTEYPADGSGLTAGDNTLLRRIPGGSADQSASEDAEIIAATR